MINIGEVLSFINDIIVETEKEEEYDEVIEEAVKIFVENNLYVKPEKCKWKMREVRFLRVVIVLEEIKIEKKDEKSIILANLKESQEHTKVFGTSQLLLAVH